MSASARTFIGLPLSTCVPASNELSPKMSVYVVDLPPDPARGCRVTFIGRVLIEDSGDVPGARSCAANNIPDLHRWMASYRRR